MSSVIRVRFAPSPTGFLHIGGVRTALFNYLFARSQNGNFLLRIEDTDRERSSNQYEKEILDSLKWLGLEWDGDIIRQSARLEIYQAACKRLVEKNLAYVVEEGGKTAVKFRVSGRAVQFDDFVHGTIRFDGKALEDFIIQKSDGFPTYHFACVVDDHETGITHVIRGDDHISNTPKQISLYEAFGWSPPKFAHLPLVFGADKTPLSKRHAAVSLAGYRETGYLPEALLNYLALLGWSPGGDQEIFFSRQMLIDQFSLERVNQTNACFDLEKLKWVNAEHIRHLSDEEYLKQISIFYSAAAFKNHPNFNKIALLYKSRIRVLSELKDQTHFFFEDSITFDGEAVRKHLSCSEVKGYLEKWSEVLTQTGAFTDPQALEALLRQTAETLGIKAAALIHPTRVALSGRSVTPGLFDLMVLLGKEVVLHRLQYVILYFNVILSGAKNLTDGDPSLRSG